MKKVVMVLSTGALALALTGCSFFGGSSEPAASAVPPPAPVPAAGVTGYSDFKGNDQLPPPTLGAPELGAIPKAHKSSKKTAVSSKSKSKSSGKTTAVAGGKTYKVVAGDTMQKISQKFYKTPKKWKKILDANKKVLSDPKKLRAGMVLRIP